MLNTTTESCLNLHKIVLYQNQLSPMNEGEDLNTSLSSEATPSVKKMTMSEQGAERTKTTTTPEHLQATKPVSRR